MTEWITTTEAARLAGYTQRHVRHLIDEGKIKAKRFGDVWQIDRRSLLAYVKKATKSGEKRGPKPKA